MVLARTRHLARIPWPPHDLRNLRQQGPLRNTLTRQANRIPARYPGRHSATVARRPCPGTGFRRPIKLWQLAKNGPSGTSPLPDGRGVRRGCMARAIPGSMIPKIGSSALSTRRSKPVPHRRRASLPKRRGDRRQPPASTICSNSTGVARRNYDRSNNEEGAPRPLFVLIKDEGRPRRHPLVLLRSRSAVRGLCAFQHRVPA